MKDEITPKKLSPYVKLCKGKKPGSYGWDILVSKGDSSEDIKKIMEVIEKANDNMKQKFMTKK